MKIENSLCILPWIHLYSYPDGRAYPCCFSSKVYPVGNTNTNSLEEIFNNTKMKDLRKNMLNNKLCKECTTCYNLEKNGNNSPRIKHNQIFSDKFNLVQHANKNGDAEYQIIYWNIAFSNICNFVCRSCGPDLSSSWYEEYKKLTGNNPKHKKILKIGGKNNDILKEFEKNINYIEKIYFAGGEPLLMEEHYKILEILEKYKKFDVRISYNTNLSKLKYKNYDIINFWKKFKNISVMASLDAYGKRAEILRKGTVWKEILENILRIKKETPNVLFSVQYTLSIYNSIHIIDFHKLFCDNNYIDKNNFNINPVIYPIWQSVKILPDFFKERLIFNYKKYMKNFSQKDKVFKEFENIIKLLEQKNSSSNFDLFLTNTKKYDISRNENIFDIFTELNDLKKLKDL